MVQDFRQQGPRHIGAEEPANTEPSQGRQSGKGPEIRLVPPPQAQRFVLKTLQTVAMVFLIAGIWLLTQDQPWIEAGTAQILGTVLVLVAVSDFVLSRVLARLWTTRNRSSKRISP